MDTKILEELEAAYRDEFDLVAGDLGALEQAVRAKMQQLGQGLLQRVVQRQPKGYKGSSMPCTAAVLSVLWGTGPKTSIPFSVDTDSAGVLPLPRLRGQPDAL